MKFWKKRKIKKIRAEIVHDPELLPDEKEYALQRLAEKERALFEPETIADQTQAVFNSLLPNTIGQIQLKRLETRNQLIREMQTTLDEVAKTKKAWERLKNVDAEIAAEQAAAYETRTEQQNEHQRKIADSNASRTEAEERTAAAKQAIAESASRHDLKMAQLQAELKAFKKRSSTEEKPKTHAQKLAELEKEHQLRRRKLEMELELIGMEKSIAKPDDEQARNNGYIAAHTQLLKTLIAQGTPKEEIRQALQEFDQTCQKNREYDLDLEPEDWLET